MAYNALIKMAQRNKKLYGVNDRPHIPDPASFEPNSFQESAIAFIRNTCEDLRFDSASTVYKDKKSQLERIEAFDDSTGRSYSDRQIPYYMQMDIDRLCLERTLSDFLKEGTSQGAFLVYYCYLEMFWRENSEGPRKMIEMLSAFEQNASPLIHSHRDHFVHSVNVFAIGLAIYQQSSIFRQGYMEHYHLATPQKAAHHFLRYWGFTALFHDLGYPFELAYTQAKDYYSGQAVPPLHLQYNKDPQFSKEIPADKYAEVYKDCFAGSMDVTEDNYTANAFFASQLTSKLYDRFHVCANYQNSLNGKKDGPQAYYEYLKDAISRKPCDPESFGGYMDHAYFSAYMLLHQLINAGTRTLSTEFIDALTAILLHNSLFKHTILKEADDVDEFPKMEIATHPLAFMLMLCDELQCWNRFGYGKKTRKENHPLDCTLTISGDAISAIYHFDKGREKEKTGTRKKFCGSKNPYQFKKDIEDILEIDMSSRTIQLTVDYDFAPHSSYIGETLSSSSFFDLYELATILNAEYRTREGYNEEHRSRKRNAEAFSKKERDSMFNQLSLEYKLANLYAVQRFARHLERIHLFFSDRILDYKEIDCFSQTQLEELGRWEHDTWAKKKLAMGWQNGTSYLSVSAPQRNNSRERFREHQYIRRKFDDLAPEIQSKDTEPYESLREILKTQYNIRIYKLS